MPFIVIFIVLPLMELMVFARVSEVIGIGTALFIAFLTAVLGGMIVKYQGLQTIAAMQTSLRDGKVPLNHIFDGFCLIAAGVTLITPGFITDTIGFLLLVPAVRNYLRRMISEKTTWAASVSGDPDVIEGEYEKIDD